MADVVLFDMDGTLTPPRQPMPLSIAEILKELSAVATIGIVSGSPFDYLIQQCSQLFDCSSEKILKRCKLFPCNGTQQYIRQEKSWVRTYCLNMREEIGEDFYNFLIKYLIQRQYVCSLRYSEDFNFVGHFISYRNSMINWSPTGRAAGLEDRKKFEVMDSKENIRQRELIKFLDNESLTDKLCFSLGGSTSIDIYPHGWDKTHVLNHYKNKDNIWFVGDRCTMEHGNDKALYDALNFDGNTKAFETRDINHTHKIIANIIGELGKNNE